MSFLRQDTLGVGHPSAAQVLTKLSPGLIMTIELRGLVIFGLAKIKANWRYESEREQRRH